jgi:arsenate reductase
MKEVKLFWMPNCSTCQKAAGWLERRGVKVTEFRDIKEDRLSRKEIEGLVEMLGEPAELFSKRAVKYREMKLNEREVSPEEMMDLMTEEYTFLKRPIMVIDGKAVAGFFEKSYLSFLDENYFPPVKAKE